MSIASAAMLAQAEEYTYYHSPAEAKVFVDNFLKTTPKDAFVPVCVENGAEYVGAAQAKKTCGCAYDQLLNDIPRFTEMVRLSPRLAPKMACPRPFAPASQSPWQRITPPGTSWKSQSLTAQALQACSPNILQDA